MAAPSKELTISGQVIFTVEEPASPLPSPSILTVKLEDCRLADASAIGVAEVKIDAHEVYVRGRPLTYNIHLKDCTDCPLFGTEVSAVLNVGWIPDASKGEWIRKGDYLSDTHTFAHIGDLQNSNSPIDIMLVQCT
eukprot:gene7601-8441_t